MPAKSLAALNAVCPYFTMFPLDIPLRLIRRYATPDSIILDPFCGRGTTNFAARLLGLRSLGIDASPVAAAIAEAKISKTTSASVMFEAKKLLAAPAVEVPVGDFWDWAFHPKNLLELASFREGLLSDCASPAKKVLRAIVMGALHGPVNRRTPSYFSNQCPRTFAPKPAYAVKYWRTRGMRPRAVDTLSLIEQRAIRYLKEDLPSPYSQIVLGDSRDTHALGAWSDIGVVVTSPPYYGMRTYVPDQWLRAWFIGGEPEVEYEQPAGSLAHSSPTEFANGLKAVWQNVRERAKCGAKLICRFGSISDRTADPVEILKDSFVDSGWRIETIRPAGSAHSGKRQATQFGARTRIAAQPEFDTYARAIH